MKLNCIIVDDEFLARQLLEGYVEKIPYLSLVGVCESAFEAMNLLQSEKIDIVFLDVNMPELNGINFIKTLTHHKPEIILTTAYSEHALEGYELDVIEYLLKPIYFERFLKATNKAKDQIELKQKAALNSKGTTITGIENNFVFIKTGPQKIIKINLADIRYIESMHEYIRINLKEESYTIHHSLKSILDILPDDTFVQIHRSYIVNFNRITFVEGNVVKVENTELSLGKNYRDAFLTKIKSKSIGPKLSD